METSRILMDRAVRKNSNDIGRDSFDNYLPLGITVSHIDNSENQTSFVKSDKQNGRNFVSEGRSETAISGDKAQTLSPGVSNLKTEESTKLIKIEEINPKMHRNQSHLTVYNDSSKLQSLVRSSQESKTKENSHGSFMETLGTKTTDSQII